MDDEHRLRIAYSEVPSVSEKARGEIHEILGAPIRSYRKEELSPKIALLMQNEQFARRDLFAVKTSVGVASITVSYDESDHATGVAIAMM